MVGPVRCQRAGKADVKSETGGRLHTPYRAAVDPLSSDQASKEARSERRTRRGERCLSSPFASFAPPRAQYPLRLSITLTRGLPSRSRFRFSQKRSTLRPRRRGEPPAAWG